MHTFYSLLKFLYICEQLAIGTPFYLSYCRVRYSGMIWRFSLLLLTWVFIYKILKYIACSSMMNNFPPELNTYYLQIQSCHIAIYLVLSCVRLLWSMWEKFHILKIEFHIHPPNKLANSYPESCAQHAPSIQKCQPLPWELRTSPPNKSSIPQRSWTPLSKCSILLQNMGYVRTQFSKKKRLIIPYKKEMYETKKRERKEKIKEKKEGKKR